MMPPYQPEKEWKKDRRGGSSKTGVPVHEVPPTFNDSH